MNKKSKYINLKHVKLPDPFPQSYNSVKRIVLEAIEKGELKCIIGGGDGKGMRYFIEKKSLNNYIKSLNV